MIYNSEFFYTLPFSKIHVTETPMVPMVYYNPYITG